jgi:hypothetical protein
MSSIFLSHTHSDKPFVRRLGADLRRAGVRIWIDEAELQIGDSLIEKIREGIDEMEYVGAVLSPSSVKSGWVQRELDVAMNQEIQGKRVKVLPILLEDCDLPGFLVGKLYADFRDPGIYEESLSFLLRKLGVDTASVPNDPKTLFTTLDGAIASRDDDLARKAIIGFISISCSGHLGLVRDVLGSIATSARECQRTNELCELTAQTLIDVFSELNANSVATIEYLTNLLGYFERPAQAFARGTVSPIISVRVGCNLALYAFERFGNSDDARSIAPDPHQPLALRLASVYILGLAAHTDANSILTSLAKRASEEPQEIHSALVTAFDILSKRAADSQVLDGLQAVLCCEAIALPVRKRAAKRFLEIEKKLYDLARQKYISSRAVAIALAADS